MHTPPVLRRTRRILDQSGTTALRRSASLTGSATPRRVGANLFEFTPSKGVDVVADAAPAAQAFPVRTGTWLAHK